ncbi:MAG: DUF6034 family protein [Wujia sp.]
MKKIFVRILVCVTLFCMTGCGKAGREEIKQDLNVVDTDNVTQTDSDENAIGEIPGHLSYTVQSEINDTKAVVDADVESTGIDNINVYEMKKWELDEDTLKAFADTFFDDGQYEVIKPYAISSREELLDEQVYLKQITEGRTYIPNELNGNEIVYYLDHYDESQVMDMPEGKLFCEVPALNRMNAQGEPMEIMTCRLRGDVDGKRWELLCTQDCSTYDLELPNDYYILKAYILEPMHYQWNNVSMDSPLVNACDFDGAEKAASDFLTQIGYEDMKLLRVVQTYCDDTLETLDGYNFLFGYSLQGIETALAANMLNYHTYILSSYNGERNAQNAANQFYIRVNVCNFGISSFEIAQLYTMGEKMSEHVECLAFEQVDEIARTYMQERLDGEDALSESSTTNFDTVRLQYVTVQYENNQYVLAPVWVYYGRASSYMTDYRSALFGVMAIDGSVIEMDEDYIVTGIPYFDEY